jgi:hypothetical protein
MAITQAVCTSFKVELLGGQHDFRGSADAMKVALYTSSASLDATTTDYTATAEVVGTGYSATGAALAQVTPVASSTTAYTDFANVTWGTSTITARGAMIYNTETDGGSGTTESILILDFGGDKTSSAGDFTITFPTADASNAILRIA